MIKINFSITSLSLFLTGVLFGVIAYLTWEYRDMRDLSFGCVCGSAFFLSTAIICDIEDHIKRSHEDEHYHE